MMKAMRAILILMLLLVMSCRTVKKVSSSEKELNRTETRAVQIDRELTEEIEFFGDTLRGFIPRIDLSKGPVTVPISSTGITQELTFTDTGVHVKTVARPVARSQLSYSERMQDSTGVREIYRESEQTQKEVTGWGLPWWVYVAGVLVLAVVVLRISTKISNPFKWF